MSTDAIIRSICWCIYHGEQHFTLDTQTMMIDTFRESADQTADKRPLTWVKQSREAVKMNLTSLFN